MWWEEKVVTVMAQQQHVFLQQPQLLDWAQSYPMRHILSRGHHCFHDRRRRKRLRQPGEPLLRRGRRDRSYRQHGSREAQHPADVRGEASCGRFASCALLAAGNRYSSVPLRGGFEMLLSSARILLEIPGSA